jgi:hypothetical protein
MHIFSRNVFRLFLNMVLLSFKRKHRTFETSGLSSCSRAMLELLFKCTTLHMSSHLYRVSIRVQKPPL